MAAVTNSYQPGHLTQHTYSLTILEATSPEPVTQS